MTCAFLATKVSPFLPGCPKSCHVLGVRICHSTSAQPAVVTEVGRPGLGHRVSGRARGLLAVHRAVGQVLQSTAQGRGLSWP